MTKHYIFSLFLFCLFFGINYGYNYMHEEQGKFVEKYEPTLEKEYYKKDYKDFHPNKEENHKDIDEWKAKYDGKLVEVNEYKTKYEKYNKNYDPENKKKHYDEEYKKKPYDEEYKKKHYDEEYKKKHYDEEYKYKKDKYNPVKYDEADNKRFKRDCAENGEQKKYKSKVTPPDHTKYIAMARFVVHQGDWASVATISVLEPVKGFPFTNVVSMSDGPIEDSTGIPYFYLTPLDFTHKDYTADNRITVTVSLAETGYCADKKWEADDPRCSRVMLSGKILTVTNGTKEFDYARNALFSRHPSMAHLPADHGFYIAKLKIANIVMLDWFGGPQTIDVREYLSYKPSSDDDSTTNVDVAVSRDAHDSLLMP